MAAWPRTLRPGGRIQRLRHLFFADAEPPGLPVVAVVVAGPGWRLWMRCSAGLGPRPGRPSSWSCTRPRRTTPLTRAICRVPRPADGHARAKSRHRHGLQPTRLASALRPRAPDRVRRQPAAGAARKSAHAPAQTPSTPSSPPWPATRATTPSALSQAPRAAATAGRRQGPSRRPTASSSPKPGRARPRAPAMACPTPSCRPRRSPRRSRST